MYVMFLLVRAVYGRRPQWFSAGPVILVETLCCVSPFVFVPIVRCLSRQSSVVEVAGKPKFKWPSENIASMSVGSRRPGCRWSLSEGSRLRSRSKNCCLSCVVPLKAWVRSFAPGTIVIGVDMRSRRDSRGSGLRSRNVVWSFPVGSDVFEADRGRARIE